MSDKAKYSGAVWFVRGVPAELRAEVATAAERAGMKVGAWVERALRAALEQPEGQGNAGDLAERVAYLAATIEGVRTLFEKHRRQDFPSVVERLERLETRADPAIPGRSSGDSGKDRVPPAIPGRQGSAPDAVKPGGSVEVPETTETHPGPSGAVSEMDVTGGDDGTRRRLTPAGDAKVDTLLRAGIGIAEIAGMFAVDQDAIHQRRMRLEAEYGPSLGVLPLELARQVYEMLKAARPPVEIQAILSPPQGDGRGCLMPAKTEALPGASGGADKGKQTRQKWTDADDDVLRRIAAEGGTQADAARELGRSDGVINAKWRALGLPVPPRKGRKLKR